MTISEVAEGGTNLIAHTADAHKNIPQRVRTIIKWLLDHQARINNLPKGRIIFHVAGRNVKPEVDEIYPDVKTDK